MKIKVINVPDGKGGERDPIEIIVPGIGAGSEIQRGDHVQVTVFEQTAVVSVINRKWEVVLGTKQDIVHGAIVNINTMGIMDLSLTAEFLTFIK